MLKKTCVLTIVFEHNQNVQIIIYNDYGLKKSEGKGKISPFL